MIPIYSSALKDNEINVSDLPRILGEGEEEPVLVWAFDDDSTDECDLCECPKRWPRGHWTTSYTSRSAALIECNPRTGWRESTLFRFELPYLIAKAQQAGTKGVVLIDESYTVIETWRV